jgi:outer membrane protein TolC
MVQFLRGRLPLLVVISLLSALAHAEPAASMTLPQALAWAREHQPRLLAERARVRAAEQRAAEPAAEWLPRIGAAAQVVGSSNNNSSTTWLSTRGVADMPRISGTPALTGASEINWSPYVNTVVGATLDQKVFDFGRIAADTAVADAATDAQRARLEDQQLTLELSVRETYYATLAAQAILQVARDAAERSRAHRDEAHARVAQGVRSRIEEIRADADLARFEVGVLRAESGLRAAQVAFAEAVGATVPLLGAIAEDAAATPAELPALDVVMSRAAERDPAIREVLLRSKAARERVHAAEVRKRPELWAVAGVAGAAGGAPKDSASKQIWGLGAVPWVPDYFLGAVLSWRFYDPVLEARVNTAAREADVAALEVDVVKEQSVARAQQAWLRADLSVRALHGLERSLEVAHANYQQAEVRFQSGLGTSVELADAEALRTAAEAELVLGRFELARAQAGLLRVVGGAW